MAAAAPTAIALFLPSQPAGNVVTWRTVSRASPAATASSTRPVASVERSSMATTSSRG